MILLHADDAQYTLAIDELLAQDLCFFVDQLPHNFGAMSFHSLANLQPLLIEMESCGMCVRLALGFHPGEGLLGHLSLRFLELAKYARLVLMHFRQKIKIGAE